MALFEKAYEKAIDMFRQQHERWNHWAIFFFGLIASAFVIRHYSQPFIPLFVPAFAGLVFSSMWVCVALSIRAYSYSWIVIIQRMESLKDEKERDEFKLFTEFDAELKRRSYRTDLGSTIKFWRFETYRRVTRLMTLLGLVLVIGFATLFVASLIDHFRK